MSEEAQGERRQEPRATGQPAGADRPARGSYSAPRLTRHGSVVSRTKVFDGDEISGPLT